MRPTALLALVAVGLLSRAARADEADRHSEAHDAAECTARVERLRHVLSTEASRAKAWRLTWTAGFLVVTAGQLAAAPFADREDRKDLYVGSASSAAGLIPLLAFPLPVIADAPAFAARASSPRTDPCVLAEEGQRLFERSAEAEAFATGIVSHVGSALFNVALGLALAIGFGHWESGAINVVAGTAIGEALILTHPTGLLRAREQGKLARFSRSGAEDAWRARLVPWRSEHGLGVAASLSF